MSEPPGHSRWSALWAGAVNFFAALCALVVVGYLTLFGVASTFADIPLPAFVKSLTTDTTLQGVLFLATPLSAFLLALRPLMTEVSGETKTTNENLSSLGQAVRGIGETLEKIADQQIRVVDFERGSNPFDGFTGRHYFALNAPLVWEFHHHEQAVETHLKRYKDPAVEVATYAYPVLAALGADERKSFIRPIQHFWRDLDGRLKDPQRKKLRFYVPKANLTEAQRGWLAQNRMTLFMGEQNGSNTLIYYQLNDLFVGSLGRPKWAFHIDNDAFIEQAKTLIVDKVTRSEHMESITLDQFLQWLDRLSRSDS